MPKKRCQTYNMLLLPLGCRVKLWWYSLNLLLDSHLQTLTQALQTLFIHLIPKKSHDSLASILGLLLGKIISFIQQMNGLSLIIILLSPALTFNYYWTFRVIPHRACCSQHTIRIYCNLFLDYCSHLMTIPFFGFLIIIPSSGVNFAS